MTNRQGSECLAVLLACGLALATGRVYGQVAPAGAAVRTPEAVIAAWPETPKRLGHLLLEKYGTPARYDSQSMVWENNRPYLKTILFKNASWIKGSILQQTIRYRALSPEIVDRLVAFDKRLVVDRSEGTMTMTSDGEKTNMLVMNLADEIASGVRTPKQARVAFNKELSLSKSGKRSAYTESFKFPIAP